MIIKTSTYVKGYDWQTKWMYFLTGDIKNKVVADIKKGFDFKPVYSEEFLKTDVKSYGDKVADFHDRKFLRWTLIILV